MILEEQDLSFDFQTAVSGEKFDDESRHGLSHCMKAVDFIIETTTKILFIEVKDPQNPESQPKDKARFLAELNSGVLIQKNLTGKARDTFLYKFGFGEVPRQDKPIHYYVLIAQDTLDSAQLGNLADNLRISIPIAGPDNKPWKSPFITACAIFNLKTWNATFPRFQARRKSEMATK